MAPSEDMEKGHVSLQHDEHGPTHFSKDSGSEQDNEPIIYGVNGHSSWAKSPFVFGAALLASMGGFSYGYGKKYFKGSHQSLGLTNMVLN